MGTSWAGYSNSPDVEDNQDTSKVILVRSRKLERDGKYQLPHDLDKNQVVQLVGGCNCCSSGGNCLVRKISLQDAVDIVYE